MTLSNTYFNLLVEKRNKNLYKIKLYSKTTLTNLNLLNIKNKVFINK